MNLESCEKCPRLRAHCSEVAREKRKAYASETYWGRPVPSFGDLSTARLFIVGLAPAAHGANRTGRMFTGDRSGDWLYRALHKAGFANQPTSVACDDGLQLKKAYITAISHCAPPDNKPTREESEICTDTWLAPELERVPREAVFLVLGQIALQGLWRQFRKRGKEWDRPTPKFSHGGEIALPNGQHLIFSFHPSQQNTFTGRLTQPMFDQVFERCRALTNRQ